MNTAKEMEHRVNQKGEPTSPGNPFTGRILPRPQIKRSANGRFEVYQLQLSMTLRFLPRFVHQHHLDLFSLLTTRPSRGTATQLSQTSPQPQTQSSTALQRPKLSTQLCLAKGWSTPISSIIRDDFVLQDEWATCHLTLEDAATHRTGMPRHDRASIREINGRKATPRDVVRNMRNLPLTVEPRTRFVYCNAMYVVLSHIIETVTGKGLGDVLR